MSLVVIGAGRGVQLFQRATPAIEVAPDRQKRVAYRLAAILARVSHLLAAVASIPRSRAQAGFSPAG